MYPLDHLAYSHKRKPDLTYMLAAACVWPSSGVTERVEFSACDETISPSGQIRRVQDVCSLHSVAGGREEIGRVAHIVFKNNKLRRSRHPSQLTLLLHAGLLLFHSIIYFVEPNSLSVVFFYSSVFSYQKVENYCSIVINE